MRRFVASSSVLSAAILAATLSPVVITGQNNGNDQVTQANVATKEVTFSKDVAPIVYANCVYCHRPGEVAPMSLLTYQNARPWARAIKRMVVERRMPPWLADPHYSSFSNDRRLSDKEIQTIVAWVDGGAKEGNPADVPAPPQFAEGWQIGVPDLVLTMKEPFTIPASGIIPWVGIPSGTTSFQRTSGCKRSKSGRAIAPWCITRWRRPTPTHRQGACICSRRAWTP
jgi:hypothetical protein